MQHRWIKGYRAFSLFLPDSNNKQKARELLTSEEGIKHRGRRCIEPEAVFGQTKYNKAYKRFRHFGKDKVNMDFAFFAIAFNIGKMCRKTNLKELKAVIKQRNTIDK